MIFLTWCKPRSRYLLCLHNRHTCVVELDYGGAEADNVIQVTCQQGFRISTLCPLTMWLWPSLLRDHSKFPCSQTHTNSPISRGPQHYSIYQGGACVIGFAQVASNADSVVVNSHEFELLSSCRSKYISCSSRHFNVLCIFNHCAKAKSNHDYCRSKCSSRPRYSFKNTPQHPSTVHRRIGKECQVKRETCADEYIIHRQQEYTLFIDIKHRTCSGFDDLSSRSYRPRVHSDTGVDILEQGQRR